MKTASIISIVIVSLVSIIILISLLALDHYCTNLAEKIVSDELKNIELNQCNERYNKCLWIRNVGDTPIKMKSISHHLKTIYFIIFPSKKDWKGINKLTGILSSQLLSLSGYQFTTDLSHHIAFYAVYLWIRRHWQAEKVLCAIANLSYYGNGYFGIEVASNGYFHKTIEELSMEEMAILILLIESPVRYDPLKYPDRTYEKAYQLCSEIQATHLWNE